MGKLEKAVADATPSNGDAAPPSYNDAGTIGITSEDIDQLNSAFTSLSVPLIADEVTIDTCLAHLKLLFAFQTLKETIGYTDGLWQIYDSRVFPDKKSAQVLQNAEQLNDETKKNLSLLREKRWALYVARAADRYEAWWNSFSTDPLTENEMADESPKYNRFADPPPKLEGHAWDSTKLPPLDVLMVWHAHMLNPRAYFEDCMRRGLKELWHLGMPWQLVNDAIDTQFDYNVSFECMARWEETTNRKWDNVDDPFTKVLPPCPECNTPNVVPWSTCGKPEDSHDGLSSIDGQGYGDADFWTNCATCGKRLKRDYLEVSQFAADVKRLLSHEHPMPGTLLETRTGLATRLPVYEASRDRYQRTFPNRLIRYHLRTQLYDPQPASMDEIRAIIERAMYDSDAIKKAERVTDKEKSKSYRLGQEARIQVRKMMSRYWGNSSPFALELGGAVVRQSIFTEKMYKMDWLHSPAARETMARLITKYGRFLDIMGKARNQIAVPTLDIDLAWHTHQLSPASYYKLTLSKTKRFIDHDDKIDENKLSIAFEWTSRVYQEFYGEVYSECTCWYCESVRTSHTSSLADRLPIFKSEKGKGIPARI
ncbi:hypothetical protein O1611_g6200 [Lasiodiplodia mahajangana]|uniref:Uncharacterized protein n=1 Tax=Lasiodiplodia mahajangana TaxID=1108764 RepID=A0ACC2JJ38_9PEZI|nr:hypothetical protein O1611_g6200 [Lasiodiplodia mahajangana]